MNIRLFIIAITPAIIGLSAIYLSDRHDREPAKLLVVTFLLGCISVIPSIIVEEILILFNIFPGVLGAFYNAFIVAGLTEEYFKRYMILKLPLRTNHFNEKLDGIVYGVFTALGFAAVENIIYVVFTYTNNPFVGLYRGIFSVPAHAIFGVTMGYYISLAKFEKDENRKRKNMLKSLFYPVLLHGVFDFILMANIPELTIFFVPYVLFLWWLNHRKLSVFLYDSKTRFGNKTRE
jgi:RsiW-degrading membrane proteinase PrsW (M82 family)